MRVSALGLKGISTNAKTHGKFCEPIIEQYKSTLFLSCQVSLHKKTKKKTSYSRLINRVMWTHYTHIQTLMKAESVLLRLKVDINYENKCYQIM